MTQRQPEGHPIVVMAAGGFFGGMIAGGNNAGFWVFAFLCLGTSYLLLMLLGHIERKDDGSGLGAVLAQSTVIPLPCGLIGMFLGKQWWGT
jgi:hypothetical protein